MPCDSTRSRSLVNPSTDHLSSSLGEISPLQMCFTPNAEIVLSTSSDEVCWVPSFMSAFLGAGLACVMFSAAAAATDPTAVVCKNCLRSIDFSKYSQSSILSRQGKPRQVAPELLLFIAVLSLKGICSSG